MIFFGCLRLLIFQRTLRRGDKNNLIQIQLFADCLGPSKVPEMDGVKRPP